MTWFISRARVKKIKDNVLTQLQDSVIAELRVAFPMWISKQERSLPDALLQISKACHSRFFIIIDEWDAVFRERKEDLALQEEYLRLLQGLIQSEVISELVAGAYMTGILPIKKFSTEPALTEFHEFAMADPQILSQYVGLTEQEGKALCCRSQLDFGKMKRWYDGYAFIDSRSVCSPYSSASAAKFRKCRSYRANSETCESLKAYITMNFAGLKDAVLSVLTGDRVSVDPSTFQNNLTSFSCGDDVLTLLCHLGSLALDQTTSEVCLPNLDAAAAVQTAVRATSWVWKGTGTSGFCETTG